MTSPLIYFISARQAKQTRLTAGAPTTRPRKQTNEFILFVAPVDCVFDLRNSARKPPRDGPKRSSGVSGASGAFECDSGDKGGGGGGGGSFALPRRKWRKRRACRQMPPTLPLPPWANLQCCAHARQGRLFSVARQIEQSPAFLAPKRVQAEVLFIATATLTASKDGLLVKRATLNASLNVQTLFHLQQRLRK